jgi:hypothetical protein
VEAALIRELGAAGLALLSSKDRGRRRISARASAGGGGTGS